MRIPMWKIRPSWDRLTFNMRIPILVRRHLYIETAPILTRSGPAGDSCIPSNVLHGCDLKLIVIRYSDVHNSQTRLVIYTKTKDSRCYFVCCDRYSVKHIFYDYLISKYCRVLFYFDMFYYSGYQSMLFWTLILRNWNIMSRSGGEI